MSSIRVMALLSSLALAAGVAGCLGSARQGILDRFTYSGELSGVLMVGGTTLVEEVKAGKEVWIKGNAGTIIIIRNHGKLRISGNRGEVLVVLNVANAPGQGIMVENNYAGAKILVFINEGTLSVGKGNLGKVVVTGNKGEVVVNGNAGSVEIQANDGGTVHIGECEGEVALLSNGGTVAVGKKSEPGKKTVRTGDVIIDGNGEAAVNVVVWDGRVTISGAAPGTILVAEDFGSGTVEINGVVTHRQGRLMKDVRQLKKGTEPSKANR